MMNKTVSIIDYAIGNILSVTRAFEHCDAKVKLVSTAAEIKEASFLVLPGVGAFADGMRGLQERLLIEPIRKYVETERPLLGICLGMQMLMEASEEFGRHQGLGLIPGLVKAIPKTDSNGTPHKIPHIGWNKLKRPANTDWKNTILEGLSENESVYFVHSFTAIPDERYRLADVYYNGRQISAAVRSGNVYGCQFHPEKSGPAGLSIIRKFLILEKESVNI